MDIDIDQLLPKMDAFVKTLHSVSIDVSLEPKKAHLATCIQYQDLSQLREEFLHQLIASVTRYVYSKSKVSEILSVLQTENEMPDAYDLLAQRAKEKFRPSTTQGQFSELLLFNLLQHHFKAIPVIRKMKLTTNVALERNGADAIHISIIDGKPIFYLGEAKTYTSSFKAAFKKSLESIVDTFANHRRELDLYRFEDFLEEEVKDLAQKFISGNLPDAETHLVCIITFCGGDIPLGRDRDETIEKFIQLVRDQIATITKSDYPEVQAPILARINYIFMPIDNLETLLIAFHKKLGYDYKKN